MGRRGVREHLGGEQSVLRGWLVCIGGGFLFFSLFRTWGVVCPSQNKLTFLDTGSGHVSPAAFSGIEEHCHRGLAETRLEVSRASILIFGWHLRLGFDPLHKNSSGPVGICLFLQSATGGLGLFFDFFSLCVGSRQQVVILQNTPFIE